MSTNSQSVTTNKTFGATAKNLWELIKLFPEESCIVLRFFYDDSPEPVKQIRIWKNNHEEYPPKLNYPSAKEAVCELYGFLSVYGLDSYRMTMEWNYGFGNSILINIRRPSTNYEI